MTNQRKKSLLPTLSFALLVGGTLVSSHAALFDDASASTHAAKPRQQASSSDDYRQYLQRIEALREARDLDGLVALADEVESKWSTLEAIAYARLMREVSGVLGSYDFKDDNQYVLAVKYAKLALEKGDALPVETQAELALSIQGDMEYATGRVRAEAWPQDRTEKMRYLFHTWRRLESEIDENFDPNDRPVGNITPPRASGLPAGVVTDAVKDPKLRAEYEAAIETNRRRAKKFNKQLTLRKVRAAFSKQAEELVVEAYLKPLSDVGELRLFLESQVADKEARTRILNKVGAARQ